MRGRDAFVDVDRMEVWLRIAEVGRRKEGISCVRKRCVEIDNWSKMLRSESCTRKRMQSGSGGECLEGP